VAVGDRGEKLRRVVFISHANPQDNDFTVWLGTRLATAGYEVWSDLTRLIGGEETWQDIDETIRQRCATVILVLSREGVKKPGLRSELAIADAVARKLSRPEFLLPVKIDDLPFDEVPPQVMPRNIIDFSHGWAAALERVLKALERDKIPRAGSDSAATLDQWVRSRTAQGKVLAPTTETLQSNWFPMLAVPERLNFFEIRRPLKSPLEVHALAKEVSWPAAGYLRLLVGFANLGDFEAELRERTPIRTAYSVGLEEFLAGRSKDGPYIEIREARKLVTNLMRQAWEKTAKARGFEEYRDADGASVWWVPNGLLSDNIGRFLRPDGRRGWRQLVGRDNTRDIYWHFGVRAWANVLAPRRLIFKPHVVFSRDGRTPLGMRQRRAVCKYWFNAKWRDLILAYAAFLADGCSEFTLAVGTSAGIRVEARPMTFDAPVSLLVDDVRTQSPTEEGDENDFDGLDRESDPFFRSDELESESDNSDNDGGEDL
jgi:hypothetical protein